MLGMAQISAWCDPIPNSLFELFHFRESALGRSRPDDILADADLKHTAGARQKSHFPNLILKRSQEFLGRPGSPQQPAALRAVFDFDAWIFYRHCSAV
jgi:hypothetical protein